MDIAEQEAPLTPEEKILVNLVNLLPNEIKEIVSDHLHHTHFRTIHNARIFLDSVQDWTLTGILAHIVETKM